MHLLLTYFYYSDATGVYIGLFDKKRVLITTPEPNETAHLTTTDVINLFNLFTNFITFTTFYICFILKTNLLTLLILSGFKIRLFLQRSF